ncbi:hypothetical protein [Dyella sp.]|uniref:hypothetical protein n=1 Tax=Dyella sp. TaxID=1869338 RepID=UPI003F7DFE26
MTKVTLSNVDEGTFGAPKRMLEIVTAVRDGQQNTSRNPRFHLSSASQFRISTGLSSTASCKTKDISAVQCARETHSLK